MKLYTRNGHNMYDMASMLQKAIRRNLHAYALYAAYELYGRYRSMLWKRLIVISAEDCFGYITSTIVRLKEMDDENDVADDMQYVSAAVNILCSALKNRDACYVACNFMTSDWKPSGDELDAIGHIDDDEKKRLQDEEDARNFKQESLFDLI